MLLKNKLIVITLVIIILNISFLFFDNSFFMFTETNILEAKTGETIIINPNHAKLGIIEFKIDEKIVELDKRSQINIVLLKGKETITNRTISLFDYTNIKYYPIGLIPEDDSINSEYYLKISVNDFRGNNTINHYNISLNAKYFITKEQFFSNPVFHVIKKLSYVYNNDFSYLLLIFYILLIVSFYYFKAICKYALLLLKSLKKKYVLLFLISLSSLLLYLTNKITFSNYFGILYFLFYMYNVAYIIKNLQNEN